MCCVLGLWPSSCLNERINAVAATRFLEFPLPPSGNQKLSPSSWPRFHYCALSGAREEKEMEIRGFFKRGKRFC